MSRIETLTPEQICKFHEYVQKWTDIGLSCEPCDFEKAKEYARRSYEIANLRPPTRWILCDSPLSGAITVGILKRTSGASVGASVGDSVWDSVWGSVRASVRDSVRASVGDSVRDSVGASVWDSVRDSIYGSHDAGWLSFYDFFLQECNLEACHKLDGLFGIAETCGWWIPYKNTCILQNRHSVLNLDDQGNLHSHYDLAVGYPDGWGVYAWHGVRVPKQVIVAPETITIDHIESQENAEIRRVMVERYGQGRYLLDSGAIAIHSDDFGTLYRKEVGNDEPIVMVKVVNSTPEPDGSFKDYFLRVPPDVQSAREAVAWSFGVGKDEYLPMVQT